MKSNASYNKPRLIKLLEVEGYEYYEVNEHQIRVMGATHIIDIWPARMTYHRIGGEDIKSDERYDRLAYNLDVAQVKRLLERGKI